ncbi:MAG TPA: P-type conjugative transfer protein TrbJ, partial [Sphingomonas sp.]|nr:P-type conjugative transfer protein TrbJ [Sphingomonas sp.]
MRILSRKYLIASLLGAGATASLAMSLSIPSQPAHAQITVFDPSNYSQNLLTAARMLQQINNQIQSLQNEAAMILNQAKNLAQVDFPELDALRQTIQQIDVLMGQAQGVSFRVDGLDQQFRQLFPNDLSSALRTNQQVIAARGRLDNAMSSFRHTMGVQAKVVENVAADARTLEALAARSQGAQGALAAQQTTNQLLALTAKQQFQIQNLMAAQYRAESM